MLVKEFKDGQWKVIDNGFGTYYADNQTRGMLKADGDTITTNNGVITCQKQKYAFNTELQYIYPGTYQWQVPDGVEFIKVLVIGGGSNGLLASGQAKKNGGFGGGALSALLKVNAKQVIELEVGTNGDAVALHDGRIGPANPSSVRLSGFTNGQAGGDAHFGDWITCCGGNTTSRGIVTFTPKTKFDSPINAITWDVNIIGKKTNKNYVTIDGATQWDATPTKTKYWRTLKAVCDNYLETYVKSNDTKNLNYTGATGTSSTGFLGQDGWVIGGNAGTGAASVNSDRSGNCYALFGKGGNGPMGTSQYRYGSAGGVAYGFGGCGGQGGGGNTGSYTSGTSGHAGPGGIFIWY